jgi:hypothetical protein
MENDNYQMAEPNNISRQTIPRRGVWLAVPWPQHKISNCNSPENIFLDLGFI